MCAKETYMINEKASTEALLHQIFIITDHPCFINNQLILTRDKMYERKIDKGNQTLITTHRCYHNKSAPDCLKTQSYCTHVLL